MPYKSEKIKLPQELDRRVKLTNQKRNIETKFTVSDRE